MKAIYEGKNSENSEDQEEENTNINTDNNFTPKVHNLQFKPNNYIEAKVLDVSKEEPLTQNDELEMQQNSSSHNEKM